MHLRRCVASIRACRGRSGWGRFPGPPGAGDAGSIEAGAFPIDLVVLTQPTQHRQMQPMPYTGGLPVSQTSPARHATAETLLLREVFPRETGLQHIQDAVERSSVVDRAPPFALGRWGKFRIIQNRDVRLDAEIQSEARSRLSFEELTISCELKSAANVAVNPQEEDFHP